MKIDSPFMIIALVSVLAFQVLAFFVRFPAGTVSSGAGYDHIARMTTAEKNARSGGVTDDLLTPDELAARFFATRNIVPAETAISKEPTMATAPVPETDHYAMLGAIEDESGIKRVYLKHRETGQVIKARFDGTAEGGIRYYEKGAVEYIEINGRTYAIERDKT